MKKALMDIQGTIGQIEEPGDDFEIYNGDDATIQWVDAPDDVQLDWTLEWSPAQETMVWVERDTPFTDPEIARKIAYGDVGDQLDMIYKEIAAEGSISASGPWASHIAGVKSTFAAVPARDEAVTEEEQMALEAVTEPSADKDAKLSSIEMPCWKRYSGWHGNQ